MDAIRTKIRDVPDFPKKGILFKDITPLLGDPTLFRQVVDALADQWRDQKISRIVAIEARGFVFAAPLAYTLGVGLAVVRKPGKLPYKTIRESYALEYGEAELELHVDAVQPGERVVVVDDLLATGGTAEAAARLVTRQGGEVAGYSFVVELSFLGGAKRLGAEKIRTLARF